MPARRSRTEQWRRGLEQIHERRGAIEIAVARHYEEDTAHGRHLIWRVQLLAIDGDSLIVEQPATLGCTLALEEGTELVGVMTIGQNRWNFETTVIETLEAGSSSRHRHGALRVRMPDQVRRCQRRNFYRMGTAELHLPEIDIWPLLDPKSVVVAERASQRSEGDVIGSLAEGPPKELLPELGPQFTATLLNLGGGGIGLCVPSEHGQILSRYKLFWLRFTLPPEMPDAICASAKVAHTHMQADQTTYAGLSFDFSYNPPHQQYVLDQITTFIDRQQAEQRLERRSA